MPKEAGKLPKAGTGLVISCLLYLLIHLLIPQTFKSLEMSKDSLHPFPAKLPLRCQIHTLIIKPRGSKKKARADRGAVRCPEEGAKACLRGKVSPRDDSGTGGDQARGTAPAKSEREGVGTSDMRGVGNGQPGLRGSAFGAKGQRHTAEKPTLPLPVVPRREQVLPRIVLFKKLRRLFYLLSGRFLQPLFSGAAW